MGFSGCAVQRGSRLSHHMNTVDVGSLTAGGLSRQSRGGVALLECWEEDVEVPVLYLPIDREAIKGNFVSPHPSLSSSVAGA